MEWPQAVGVPTFDEPMTRQAGQMCAFRASFDEHMNEMARILVFWYIMTIVGNS